MSTNLTPYSCFTKPITKSQSPLFTVGGRTRIHPQTVAEEYYIDILSSITAYYKQTQETKDKYTLKQYKHECQVQIKNYFHFIGLDTTIIDAEFVLGDKDILDTNGEIITQLLDAGIHQIIIDIPSSEEKEYTALQAILFNFPRGRLGVHYPSLESIYEHQDFLTLVEKISVPYKRLDDLNLFWDLNSSIQDCLMEENRLVFVTSISEDHVGIASSLSLALFEKKVGVSLALLDPTSQQLGECYTACIRCDRKDGLFSTVVCTRDMHALGLVYSSKESIISSLETGRGTYYSRSRQSLWRKGDTSGHYQTLHRIDIDCDRDAVLFTITQHGKPNPAFCHLYTLSCWGEMRGLHHLESTLQSRLTNPEPGSYTQRLFNDDELLKQKLVEESLELIEAKTKQHVAEELADVLYFALVKGAKHGVGIEDAIRELEKRSRKVTRRKGDSKKERIEEGKKVVEESMKK